MPGAAKCPKMLPCFRCPGADLAAAWRSESAEQDGSGGGIYGRRFTFPSEPGPTVQLLLEVLDGCVVNGRYWVFAGGLTNVQTEIRVFDTLTVHQRVYRNPQGAPFEPVQDTQAFPTCQ